MLWGTWFYWFFGICFCTFSRVSTVGFLVLLKDTDMFSMGFWNISVNVLGFLGRLVLLKDIFYFWPYNSKASPFFKV